MIEKSGIKVTFPEKMTSTSSPVYPKIEYTYSSLTDELSKKNDINMISIIWWLIKASPKIIKIISLLINIVESLKMKNWKTTLTVVLGAIAYLCNMLFKIEIPQEAILAVVVFFVGIFAKDAGVTGTEK
jgi:hypothetical protein